MKPWGGGGGWKPGGGYIFVGGAPLGGRAGNPEGGGGRVAGGRATGAPPGGAPYPAGPLGAPGIPPPAPFIMACGPLGIPAGGGAWNRCEGKG